MANQATDGGVVLALAAGWNRLERRLDASLGAIRGISFAEYRLLHALSAAPRGSASRVDLARTVGLTPSGVTRALRPLEKMHVVESVRSERDARLALATLTPAGREVVADAARVLDDVMRDVTGGAGSTPAGQASLAALIETLSAVG